MPPLLHVLVNFASRRVLFARLLNIVQTNACSFCLFALPDGIRDLEDGPHKETREDFDESLRRREGAPNEVDVLLRVPWFSPKPFSSLASEALFAYCISNNSAAPLAGIPHTLWHHPFFSGLGTERNLF